MKPFYNWKIIEYFDFKTGAKFSHLYGGAYPLGIEIYTLLSIDGIICIV